MSAFGAFGTLWVLAPLFAELAEFGLQGTASRALVAGTFSLRALARARAATFAGVGALVLLATTTPLAGLIEGMAPPWLQLGVLAVLIHQADGDDARHVAAAVGMRHAATGHEPLGVGGGRPKKSGRKCLTYRHSI